MAKKKAGYAAIVVSLLVWIAEWVPTSRAVIEQLKGSGGFGGLMADFFFHPAFYVVLLVAGLYLVYQGRQGKSAHDDAHSPAPSPAPQPLQPITQTQTVHASPTINVYTGSPQSYEPLSINASAPRITWRDPGAIHVESVRFEARPQHLRDITAWVSYFMKVRFVNDPPTSSPSAVARDVIAKISFFRDDQCLRIVDGRWSESHQPNDLIQAHQSIVHLLRMDFGIGDERSLDIACKRREAEYAFIFNNDSYLFQPSLERPDFALAPGDYRVSVRLRGPSVDEVFGWRFRNPGVGSDLLILERT
jgi:hypothetical protein